MTFDIALLGREARADRVRHRLDRTMVDALVDHLAADTSDQRSAGTLYDQLIPHDLRSDFQTTSAIQFVVDATTAKYPWELLGAPRPNGRRSAGGSFGGVIRQFTESDSRRLSPVRADFGSALVIAAGKVPGERELPAVYDECQLVAQLLASAEGRVTQLDDRRSELDLVDLQNELFGEHQVLHIASHGVYQEDHPQDSGAILARGAMLTTDTIRQLTTVPDVVFLNCCSLGRIGLNRMAAGLAREFMAIGVRALIAAAWPIDDKAAQVFAETFYRELIAGRPLGDTVTRARNTCAEIGGRETWAAYQCYGDPGFVLRGSRLSLGEAVAEPVSESDLIARLDGLAVRVSDLGRPGRGGVVDRRNRLLETWNQLAGWIDGRRELAMNSPIQRRLATTARDLGEYRVAAARFRHFVVGDHGSTPVVGPQVEEASVADVQQAANCLARAGQWAARQAMTDPSPEALQMAMGELSLAADLARAGANLLPNRESLGVLGSALKRWATVDAARRDELLTEALDTYRRADQAITDTRFGAENALQLALILGGEHAEWATTQLSASAAEQSSSSTEASGAQKCRVDQRRMHGGDFWSRADAGDRSLTKLVAAADEASRKSASDDVVLGYERAFASRSTWAQRQSAIDHVGDLLDLLPAEDGRRVHLLRVLDQLDKWEQTHIERVGVPSTTPVATTATPTPAARAHDLASGVAVTAFPAGCGDCLLVEWDGSTGHHRLLVDGGMPSALDGGLGRYAAGQPAGHLTVDVAVVTHIDLDHIGGMIEAFKKGLVESPNVWFNGLDEIRSVTRGPRQGDELSALIPAERRNLNVSGGAIVLPDDGQLPMFEIADGARCTLLGPTLERLVTLEGAWASGKRGGGEDPIDDLLHRLGD
ncbi:MAG TPA: CHAT domain-containing protein, partial [Ilumatobacteraceae bacterium]|nr:CHAT domain-containing protein [Ilumatobacteraceae bacterium]